MNLSSRPRIVRISLSLILVSLVLSACGAGTSADDPSGVEDTSGGAGGAPSGDFCENVAFLEIAMREDRPHIQAVLEGQTPPGYEEQVAVIGQFMEIVNEGGNPHQDTDFLDAYDNAWNDLRDWCGLRGEEG